MAKCKSCGAEILWIKTEKGKMMPCNLRAIPVRGIRDGMDEAINRIITVVTRDGRIQTGIADPSSPVYGFESHFATCPYAGKHRKKN